MILASVATSPVLVSGAPLSRPLVADLSRSDRVELAAPDLILSCETVPELAFDEPPMPEYLPVGDRDLAPVDRSPVLLSVPSYVRIAGVTFQSQLATGCTSGNYCCGLAAANMATSFQWGQAPTAAYLRAMYEHLGLASCCRPGTTIYDQRRVAISVGNCPSSTAGKITYSSLKSKLASGKPVVVALRYGALSNRCSTYASWHSVLVVGYDEPRSSWFIHDPLCSTASRGAYKSVPSDEFRSGVDAYAREAGYTDGNSVFAMTAQR
jgi:hypothetical protein